jgi:hypothetical protein
MKINEVLLEGSVGPFWPAMAKLKKTRTVLDYPAATLMSPKVWELIVAALADKLTFKELSALDEELKKRIGG